MILHKFSIGLRSGKLMGHFLSSRNSGDSFYSSLVALAVRAGAPSWTNTINRLWEKSFFFDNSSVLHLFERRGLTSFSSIFFFSSLSSVFAPKEENAVTPRSDWSYHPRSFEHFALPLNWYAGGTWISCDPKTTSFFWLGRLNRYFEQSSPKRKFSHSSAVWCLYFPMKPKRTLHYLCSRVVSSEALMVFILSGSCISILLTKILKKSFTLQLFADFYGRIHSLIFSFFY